MIITLIVIVSFVGTLYFISKSNWLMVIVCGLVCYGACVYRNEVKIDKCVTYLTEDERIYNKKVFMDSNGQVKLDHVMGLQYARPLCIQMNQVFYYNAGFSFKR